MPVHIVIVHNDAAFLETVCAALSASGKSVCGYSDAMQALDALEDAATTDVLVTRVDFGRGTLNGVALARMAQFRKPVLTRYWAERHNYRISIRLDHGVLYKSTQKNMRRSSPLLRCPVLIAV